MTATVSRCFNDIHSCAHWINRLLQLESDELVNCSDDRAIKLWNIDEGFCQTCAASHKIQESQVTSRVKSDLRLAKKIKDLVFI